MRYSLGALLLLVVATACMVAPPVPPRPPPPAPVADDVEDVSIVQPLVDRVAAEEPVPIGLFRSALGEERRKYTMPVPPHHTVWTWRVARGGVTVNLHVVEEQGVVREVHVR